MRLWRASRGSETWHRPEAGLVNEPGPLLRRVHGALMERARGERDGWPPGNGRFAFHFSFNDT